MDTSEVPRLIAQIALADPRIRRDDPAERRGQVAMWAPILAHVPYGFAVQAAQQHYAKSPFPLLPADIAARWNSDVRARMDRHTDPDLTADPDDTDAWIGELRAQRAAVASGSASPARAAVGPGPDKRLRAICGGVGQQIPKAAAEQIAAATPGLARRRAEHPELGIACPVPTCRALPRRWCTTPSGKRLSYASHPSRLDAWIVAEANSPAVAQ